MPPDTVWSFESERTKTLSGSDELAIVSAHKARGIQILENGQVAVGPGVALKPLASAHDLICSSSHPRTRKILQLIDLASATVPPGTWV